MSHVALLIPGFFGFGALGDIRYFAGVPSTLETALGERGRGARVLEVQTHPTASLRRRAGRVLEAIRAHTSPEDHVHLVGHSTGGLDARLAIAPNADLDEPDAASLVSRVRSVVTVSTPHGGSPLATFFASVAGAPLLKLLMAASVAFLDRGRVPLAAVIKLGDMARTFDDVAGLRETALDELYRGFLAELDADRREALKKLLEEVGDDASLLFQLTPEGVDLLDAATGDPDDVRCGCVLTHAPPPKLGRVMERGRDVYAHALHGLYALLSLIARRSRVERARGVAPNGSLVRDLPDDAHDGVVPTLSQVWGDVVATVRADHLDAIGHFGGAHGADWLPSGSGFDDDRFEELWGDVAGFQLAGC